jgi:hypothetical protein
MQASRQSYSPQEKNLEMQKPGKRPGFLVMQQLIWRSGTCCGVRFFSAAVFYAP